MLKYFFSAGFNPTAWGSPASILIHGFSITGSLPHTILRTGPLATIFQPRLCPLMVSTNAKRKLQELNLRGLEFQPVELVQLDEYIEWDEWDRLDPDSLSNLDDEQMGLDSWMLREHEEKRSTTASETEVWAATSPHKIELRVVNDGEKVWTGDRVKIGRQPTKWLCDANEMSAYDFSISKDHFPKAVFSQKCADALDELHEGFLKYTNIYPQTQR